MARLYIDNTIDNDWTLVFQQTDFQSFVFIPSDFMIDKAF